MVKRRSIAKLKVTVSFCSIAQYFEALPDPRHRRNRRHLLVDIIIIAVCGVIVGCDGPTSIRQWAEAKEDWLKQSHELPDDFSFKNQWPGLRAVGMAVRTTEQNDGTTSGDVRYFISSAFMSGKRFARLFAATGVSRILCTGCWK